MSDKPSFFAELKRRNVYKVAVAYAVVGWLLVQVATQVFPFFEIPNWAVRLVVLLLILGFPVALILSWAFEITPEGIKRESKVSPNESITHHTGRKIVAVTVVYLGLGDRDEALNWLEQGYRDRDGFNMGTIWTDQFLVSLHGDPRFEALAEKIMPAREFASAATAKK